MMIKQEGNAMMDISYTAASESTIITRDSLSGSWILDKNRGNWSMRGYLETLNVPELAIQANEKGETELDTIHTIKFSPSCFSSSVIKSEEGDETCDQKFKEVEQQQEKVTIIKRSRVNNDLVVELILGEEKVDYLKPDDRPKKQLATTDDAVGKTHLKIVSSLLTVVGMANVTDNKTLVQETTKSDGKESSSASSSSSSSVMIQELTILNPETNKTHITTRYFKPCDDPTPLSSALLPETVTSK
jgi:hypothetical protein